MIKVYKETIIYIACPANVMTGGPELLHQLAHKLNKLGFNAENVLLGGNIRIHL